MEGQRLADIRAGDAASCRSYGSGYLIAPQLVLTARHAVVDSGTGRAYERIDVRVGHVKYGPLVRSEGTVCWTDPANGDVALVWLSAGVHPPGSAPVRWGRLSDDRLLPYMALGYPLLAEYTDGERYVETLRGEVAPLSTAPGTMLVLDQGVAPRLRPDGARAWSGVSGAAVFCRGALVGVVVRDDAEFENKRLHAWPSYAFAGGERFVALLSRHGGGEPRIEDVSGPALDEGKPVDGAAAVSDASLVWPTPAAGTSTVSSAGVDAHGAIAAHAAGHVPARAAPAWLRPAPATFTGREAEVQDLLAFLDVHRADRMPTSTALLVGMAGVGKTALALHVAHAARDRGWFSGGVLFLEANGYRPNGGTAATGLAERLLEGLGVVDFPRGREDLPALWHDRLARLDRAGASVLVVLDNVSAVDQVASLLPGGSVHRMVITSRHDLADLDARHIRLGVLDSLQSVSLVDACLRVVRPEDRRFAAESPETVRLAKLCGGLPLALQTIASLLRSELRLSPGELAEELADRRMRLDGLSSDGMSAPVRAAFDLSLRHLTPEQARMFRLMSVNPGPHVATDAMAAVIERSTTVARRILRSLAGAHLIERGTAAGASDTWTMHDLVRIYAQEQAERDSPESAAALDRLLDFYVRRAQSVWRSVSTTRRASGRDGFANTKEAMTWLYAEQSNILAAGMRAFSVRRADAAVNLVRFLVEYLVHQGQGEELVELTREAMKVTRGGPDRDVAVETLSAHAHALVSAGRPEEAVTALRSELGTVRDDLAREGTLRLALGSALRHADRLKEAASQSRAAARLFEEAGDLQRKGFALTNLGNALRRLDLPRQAIDAHHETTAAFRQAGDRYREAFALNNLGNALADIGDREAAYAALRRAVELFRECGAAHLEINASVNLTTRLRKAGRHAEAAGIWDNVAKLCHRLGNTEREFAALSEAGKDLHEVRDFPRLLDVSVRSVACARAMDDRAHEAGMVNNVAICLSETGRPDGAVMNHVRAAVLYSGIPASEEPDPVAQQVGCALAAARRINEPGEAGDVLLKAAALLAEAGLQEWEAWLKSDAGLRLKEADRLEQSVAVLQDAAATFEGVGDRSRQGRALNNLGISLHALSRYEEAARAIRQDLAICRDGGDRPGLATSLLNLGETLSASGDKASAVDHWREALAILEETGRDSDTVDEVRKRIAETQAAETHTAETRTTETQPAETHTAETRTTGTGAAGTAGH